MEATIWDFREQADRKAETYEFYHLNSEHTPRTQSFNAPKMDYKLPEKREEEREIVWTVPYMEDIPDDGFTLKDAFPLYSVLSVLLGANGIGKSTLLRTLSAFQPKLGGEILYFCTIFKNNYIKKIAYCRYIILSYSYYHL